MRPLLFAAAATLLLSPLPAAAQTVVLTLTGVEARGGQIVASVNTEAQFMRAAPLQSLNSPGDQTGEVVLTFTDVAPGDYAVMVMHDINDNGRFDMGAMGPLDGWAFSNGDGPMTGMPSFAEHRFTVTADGAELTERMHYGDGR